MTDTCGICGSSIDVANGTCGLCLNETPPMENTAKPAALTHDCPTPEACRCDSKEIPNVAKLVGMTGELTTQLRLCVEQLLHAARAYRLEANLEEAKKCTHTAYLATLVLKKWEVV